MTHPDDPTQLELELEHEIRYGTWAEHAARDPLDEDAEPPIPSDDDEMPLSLTDIEILEEPSHH